MMSYVITLMDRYFTHFFVKESGVDVTVTGWESFWREWPLCESNEKRHKSRIKIGYIPSRRLGFSFFPWTSVMKHKVSAIGGNGFFLKEKVMETEI